MMRLSPFCQDFLPLGSINRFSARGRWMGGRSAKTIHGSAAQFSRSYARPLRKFGLLLMAPRLTKRTVHCTLVEMAEPFWGVFLTAREFTRDCHVGGYSGNWAGVFACAEQVHLNRSVE
jgi:hypothetical protein